MGQPLGQLTQYIGTSEPARKITTQDLLAVFQNTCLDLESFRDAAQVTFENTGKIPSLNRDRVERIQKLFTKIEEIYEEWYNIDEELERELQND